MSKKHMSKSYNKSDYKVLLKKTREYSNTTYHLIESPNGISVQVSHNHRFHPKWMKYEDRAETNKWEQWRRAAIVKLLPKQRRIYQITFGRKSIRKIYDQSCQPGFFTRYFEDVPEISGLFLDYCKRNGHTAYSTPEYSLYSILFPSLKEFLTTDNCIFAIPGCVGKALKQENFKDMVDEVSGNRGKRTTKLIAELLEREINAGAAGNRGVTVRNENYEWQTILSIAFMFKGLVPPESIHNLLAHRRNGRAFELNFSLNTKEIKLIRRFLKKNFTSERRSILLGSIFDRYDCLGLLIDSARWGVGTIGEAGNGVAVPANPRSIIELHDWMLNQMYPNGRIRRRNGMQQAEFSPAPPADFELPLPPFIDKVDKKLLLISSPSETRSLEVLLPRHSKDLFEWGDRLHHCVGSYASYVKNGECWILGIKDVENNKIKYCLEIRNKQITQIRGLQNSAPLRQDAKIIMLFLIKNGIINRDGNEVYVSNGEYFNINREADFTLEEFDYAEV